MAEEIKETENNITPEEIPAPSDDKKIEVDTTEMPDSSGNKPDDGPSFVQKTMEKLGLRKPTESETSKETEEEGDLIPDEFIAVVEKLGWDKEEIIKFASDYSDEDLLDMIPFLMEEDESGEPEEPAKEKETPSHEAESKPEEKESQELKELRKELAEIKQSIKTANEAKEVQEYDMLIAHINDTFDEVGKEFEVFGKTKDLPVFPAGPKKGQYVPNSPQMKARNAVWEIAGPLISSGMNPNEAMDKAITWYKGAHLEKDVKRNLIKDLKQSEKKLSAKRTSKETMPSYESEEERQIAFVKEQAAKLGIKLNED